MIKRFLLCLVIVLISLRASAQKVGLVLSGGGAKGLAHIGALIALEENNIPIDYITGTSMGALVGGFYAAGYSPSELEYIAESKNFQQWVIGDYTTPYSYFYQRKAFNPSIGSIGLGIDSGFQARFNSNLINDIPLNFALLELGAAATIKSNWNFDSLMIPFRCMISDVFSQEQIAVKSGSLSEALRASITIPYVYRPIKINDRYVFDGGLYNNFPVDVMMSEFKPDIIIGINVSSKTFTDYPFKSDEEVLAKLFNYLLLSKSDSSLLKENGIYIQPNVNKYSVVEFNKATDLIKIGYDETMRKMPEIKALISRQQSVAEKKEMRAKFTSQNDEVVFNAMRFKGVNSKQRVYIRDVLKQNYNRISLVNMKEGYYKLVSDENFKSVYPKIVKAKGDVYDFELDVKPEQNFRASIGGNISSRPINLIYLGLAYNYLNTYSVSLSTDLYLGRFYESAGAELRFDFPLKTPVFIDLNFVYNHWDFFKGSDIFLQDPILNFVDQSDRSLIFTVGIPGKGNGKWMLKSGGINVRDYFSQTNSFQEGDTLDQSVFNAFKYAFEYENYTLDQKQFATKGKKMRLSLQYYTGFERYLPGSESILNANKEKHEWFKFNLEYLRYFNVTEKYKIGWSMDVVASNQSLFTSYRSSIINASSFNTMFDAKTFMFENYRALSFASTGIQNIYKFNKNLHARLEVYLFQPYEKILDAPDQKPTLGKAFQNQYFAGIASFVYKSPVGPISINTSYYDYSKNSWYFMLNMGYLIFQRRAME